MRRAFASLLALLAVGVTGWLACGLQAQVAGLPTRVEARTTPPLAVPFGPGERLEYDVRLGALGRRGEGYMHVVGLDSIRGRTTYHVSMGITGGIIWTQVNDQYQSWFDVTNLVTYRFIQDIDELAYERYRHWEIFPDDLRFERRDKVESGEIPTRQPLDDVSFFYFVRTLPLEVGEEYTFNRYFKESGNPVILRVLRKEVIEVPAGTFRTVVVQPLIKTSGLFGEGGEAELYFSDDDRRLLVLMRSKVPVLGSLSLHLREVTEGSRLRAWEEANAEELKARLALPEPRPIPDGGTGGRAP